MSYCDQDTDTAVRLKLPLALISNMYLEAFGFGVVDPYAVVIADELK